MLKPKHELTLTFSVIFGKRPSSKLGSILSSTEPKKKTRRYTSASRNSHAPPCNLDKIKIKIKITSIYLTPESGDYRGHRLVPLPQKTHLPHRFAPAFEAGNKEKKKKKKLGKTHPNTHVTCSDWESKTTR
jgi:hypothetical protein